MNDAHFREALALTFAGRELCHLVCRKNVGTAGVPETQSLSNFFAVINGLSSTVRNYRTWQKPEVDLGELKSNFNMVKLHDVESVTQLSALLQRKKKTMCKFLQEERLLHSSSNCPVCDSKITMMDVRLMLLCIFLWCVGSSPKEAKNTLGISVSTVYQVYEYVRDVCSWQLLQVPEKLVFGGPGKTVEIDESKFAPRKHNVGRITRGNDEWVLGIYSREEKRGALELVRACTNQVEGWWGVSKKKLRKMNVQHSINIERHLDVIMWQDLYARNGVQVTFRNILDHIRACYKAVESKMEQTEKLRAVIDLRKPEPSCGHCNGSSTSGGYEDQMAITFRQQFGNPPSVHHVPSRNALSHVGSPICGAVSLTSTPAFLPPSLMEYTVGFAGCDLSACDIDKWLDLFRTTELQRKAHLNFVCSQTGVHIYSSNPMLCASPDGLVSCDCCGEGVLEIKSPYLARNLHPRKGALAYKNSKDYLLTEEGSLKSTHAYYYQIQGQLAILDRPYCDLCVYTKKGIHVTRVYRDLLFWHSLEKVLLKFYWERFVPYYLSQYMVDH
ncbi:hypothetical protein B566_EDAN014496 [Ephemera danica]|nr:hypothetical protein B566_EDAN014496 [Ephemera danica]